MGPVRRPPSAVRRYAAPSAGDRHSRRGPHAADSRHAHLRLQLALALRTIDSAGLSVGAVMLPAVQAEFGAARAEASLPYMALMTGFGVGDILMGRLADRFSSAGFAPLVADASLWFVKRRGMAVAVCDSGNWGRAPSGRPWCATSWRPMGGAHLHRAGALQRAGDGWPGAADAPAPAGGRTGGAEVRPPAAALQPALRPEPGCISWHPMVIWATACPSARRRAAGKVQQRVNKRRRGTLC